MLANCYKPSRDSEYTDTKQYCQGWEDGLTGKVRVIEARGPEV